MIFKQVIKQRIIALSSCEVDQVQIGKRAKMGYLEPPSNINRVFANYDSNFLQN